MNQWNASRVVGQARKPELGLAFGASLISTVQPKNLTLNFTIFSSWQNNDRIPGKVFKWEKLWFRDFQFKIRFKAFWIYSEQKIFRPKFLSLSFFTILAILAEKRLGPTKKNYTGKNFRFRNFRFKIRFKPFWIDSDQKKFFDQNFLPLSFFRYFGHFGRKTTKSREKNFTREKVSISRFSF